MSFFPTGGHAFVSTRYGEATKDQSLIYLDSKQSKNRFFSLMTIYSSVNNLYGGAMCSGLPLSDFRYLSDEEIKTFDYMGTDASTNDGLGYIVTASFKYDKKLHKKHR